MTSRVSLHPNPAIPFMVACVGIAFFSLMDVAMKDLSIAIGAYAAVFWRMIIGSIITGLLFLAGGNAWPKSTALKIHFRRSVVVSIMAVTFFWALARLPIAEAIGLSFFAPVIALYLAAILLHERIGKEAIIASVAGIMGVVVIVAGKFSGEYDSDALWGTLAVMFSACLFAYNLILAREQAQQAGPVEIAFFQNFFTMLILGLAAPFIVRDIPFDQAGLLTIASLLAIVSLLILSWAYARAEAQILIPVEYTGFVWAVIFGWYYFDEVVTWPTILGTVLIITGSFVAARVKEDPQLDS